jgi:leader peptidase (prepilin peptidase)/N-methyltransferase
MLVRTGLGLCSIVPYTVCTMRPAWLDALVFAYITAIGACVGSFVNVVVSRLPEALSVVRPRSRCPQCLQPLAWYDNVPVLSYVLLRGRCRACHKRIALRYVLVEVLAAGLFAALYVRFGLSWPLAVWLPLSAALLAITFLDIDHWWVPDSITYPGMAYALATQLLPGRMGLVQAALGLVPALLLFGVGWVFERVTKKEGMGLGDIKLLAMLGLALGIADSFTLLMLAALQGAAMGTLIIATGGHKDATAAGGAIPVALADDDWEPHPHAVPFGPFLALATFEVVLLPQVFGAWHARLAGLILQAM